MTEWILPCSGMSYDINTALRELKTIEWYQSKPMTNVSVGDVMYIYASTPVQSICWKCNVTDSHRMISQINDSKYYIPQVPEDTHFDGPFIVIEAECEFTVGDHLSYAELKKHGMKSRIQGPLRLNPEVFQYVHQIEKMQDSPDEQKADAEKLSDVALNRLAIRYSKQTVKSRTLKSKVYIRNQYIAEYIKRRAKGICQLCGQPAPFSDINGAPYLEAHHIIWLSRGGTDSIDNTVALCPNCHMKMHIVDDVQDVKKLQSINKGS